MVLVNMALVKMYVFLPVLIVAVLAGTCTGHDIREPPSVQAPAADDIPDEYVRRGGTFQLPCEATGKPEPTYTWLHYGKELDLNKQNIRQLENGTIEISDFDANDQGEFQCVASNKYGKSLSQIFKVMVAFIDEAGHLDIETFSANLGSSYVVSKKTVYIKPISWYELTTVGSISDQYPRKVDLDKHVNIDPEGNVIFSMVQASDALEDGRFYKLVVHNAALRQSMGVCYFHINVDTSIPPIDQSPALLFPETSETVSLLEGTGRRIPCMCSGYPLANVTWTGPSQSLFTLEDSGTSLVLDRITKVAEGNYTCKCDNGVGTSSVTITVEMQTPPKFTTEGRPSMQTITEGETAIFVCQTTEDTTPQATIEWMVNGVPLPDHSPGARTKVINIENGKNLTIIKVNRDEDIKVIQCKASNMHETVYVDAPLNVLKKTTIMEKPVNQVIESNTTQVVFVCRASSDPSTPPTVQWQRDGKALSNYDDSRIKEDKKAGTLTLNLTGLPEDQREAYSGEYTCTATNGYSNDSHTAVLEYRELMEGLALWTICVIYTVLLIFVIFIIYIKYHLTEPGKESRVRKNRYEYVKGQICHIATNLVSRSPSTIVDIEETNGLSSVNDASRST